MCPCYKLCWVYAKLQSGCIPTRYNKCLLFLLEEKKPAGWEGSPLAVFTQKWLFCAAELFIVSNLPFGSLSWVVVASCTLVAAVESPRAFQKSCRTLVGSQTPFFCICKRRCDILVQLLNVQTQAALSPCPEEIAAAGVEVDI